MPTPFRELNEANQRHADAVEGIIRARRELKDASAHYNKLVCDVYQSGFTEEYIASTLGITPTRVKVIIMEARGINYNGSQDIQRL